MQLQALELSNFRLYQKKTFLFDRGINVIHGQNGCGKTTLLEAMYLLISGRSFRSQKLSELIRHGAEDFRIEAHFVKHGVEQKLALWSDGKVRKFFYNGTLLSNTSSLLGILIGGLFVPDDIELIKGAPSVRRNFINLHLAQYCPLYIHHFMRYSRALQQRNSLLRNGYTAGLDIWEEQLAIAGAFIIKKRQESLTSLQKRLSQLLGDTSCWQITYRSSFDKEDELIESLRKQYVKQRQREIAMGHTLVGPQRDEILFTREGKPLKNFASEGQQRAAVATLRLAQWYELKEFSELTPLMLIDDGWLGLDPTKRQEQAEKWQQMGQLFFTSTENSPFSPSHHISLEES
jgi:DNA replication and repair protein RecF